MDDHPWRDIGLEVYESHMSDDAVGQLQRLHEITRAQLADNPAHTIGILGIAGGNGLDLVDPDTVAPYTGTTSTPSTSERAAPATTTFSANDFTSQNAPSTARCESHPWTC